MFYGRLRTQVSLHTGPSVNRDGVTWRYGNIDIYTLAVEKERLQEEGSYTFFDHTVSEVTDLLSRAFCVNQETMING